MGVVYEAWDRQHLMRVALKTLPLADPSSLYRFKQEFRNLTGLVHPNLATLYELFSVDQIWFFTMEFVDGSDLLAYVRYGDAGPNFNAMKFEGNDEVTAQYGHQPDRSLSKPSMAAVSDPAQFDRLRRVLRQVVGGLNVLHAAGKLHRDIKPTNIMVTPAGRAVVLDFGLSIAMQAGVQSEDEFISGTFSYMAPEQAMGLPLTAAADLYAVGSILFEALTGQLPFDGPPLQVLRAKQASEAPRALTLAEGSPKDLAELCADLLQQDPRRRPSGEQILSRLGGSAGEPLELQIDRVPLIGRSEHLGALRSAFSEVRRGRSTAVFVHGSSGSGKSFLINRALEEFANTPTAVILSSRCYEAESVPYKGLDSLIDALSRFLARESELAGQVVPRDARALLRLFPVLGDVEPLALAREHVPAQGGEQELRRRAARGLRELLSRLGDRVPLILSIDALQWGDADSGDLLSEIFRGPDPPILLLICSYRSEHARTSPVLRRLLESPAGVNDTQRKEIALGVLTQGEARALAAELLRDQPGITPSILDTIARESQGAPYFVHELARFVEGGAILSEGITLSLDHVLTHRLDALPPAPRRLLEVIALAGQPIRQREAYDSADLHGEDRAAAAQLRSRHLVRSSGPNEDDVIEPYHDRVRETLVGTIPADRRKLHHGRLALVLETSGTADPEVLAVHFLESDDRGRAAGYYATAADQAARALAFDRAAQLYRRALSLHDPTAPQAHPLRVGLGDALANAGRGREAADAYRAALSGAKELEAIDLRRRAAYQLCISGHLAEGRTEMRELLREHGVRLPETRAGVIAQLLLNRLRLWFRRYEFEERAESKIDAAVLSRIDVIWSASAGLSMIDTVAGAALQVEGLLAALDAGEIDRVARSLAWEATHHGNLGSSVWPHTAKLLGMAEELAGRSQRPHPLGMATLTTGIAEFLIGRFASAVPLLDQAETIFRERCTGVAWEIDTAHAFAGYSLVHMGSFAELARRTPVAMKEADERGDLFAYTTLGAFMQPHVHLASDDAAAARSIVETSRKLWPTTGFYLQTLCGVMADGLIDLYEDDGQRAWQRFMDAWKEISASQLLRSQMLRALTYSYRGRAALSAASRSAEREKFLRLGEADAKRVAAEGAAWCAPYSQLMFATAALVRGERSKARDLLQKCSVEFDEIRMPSYAAAARRLSGQIIGGSGGESLIGAADEFFAREGVKNPEAMARMHTGVSI